MEDEDLPKLSKLSCCSSYHSFYSSNDSDSSSSSSSQTSLHYNNGEISSSTKNKKKKKFDFSGIKLPPGFLEPLPTLPQKPQSCVQNSKFGLDGRKISSCLKNADPGAITKTEFCVSCIEKWISDIMKMRSLDVNKFTGYLRREFRLCDLKEVEKRLRDWEEEERRTQELARKAGDLGVELKDSKKKYYEVMVGMGKLESVMCDVEEELEVYKVANEELRVKVARLEDMDRDKGRVVSELNKTCEEYKVSCDELRAKVVCLEDINKDKCRVLIERDKTCEKLRERVSRLKEVNRKKGEELVEFSKYKVASDKFRVKAACLEDKIRDTCKVVIERNKTCEELRKEVSRLQEVNRNKGEELTQLAKYKVASEDLKEKAACLEKTNEDMLMEIGEFNKTCDEMRDRISHLDKVNRDKSEELVELSKYKVTCDEFREEVSRLQEVNRNKGEELIQLGKYKVASEELNEKAARLEETNRDRFREISELNKTCDELRKRVSHLDKVNSDKSEELIELRKYKVTCDDFREEVSHLQEVNRNRGEELIQLGKYKVAFEELKEKAAHLEEISRDRFREISELNKTCGEFRERVSQFDKVNRDKSEELVELSKYRVTCDEYRGKAACLEEINKDTCPVRMELNKTCDELGERICRLEEVRRDKDKVSRDEFDVNIVPLEKDGHDNKELKTYSRDLRRLKKRPPYGTSNLEMESGIECHRSLRVRENSCLIKCSEASKVKARTELGNENDTCVLKCNERAGINEIYSPEWQKRSQENGACATINAMETKKRNRENLVEQAGMTKMITIAEVISNSELLEEREKKRRNQNALKKQSGATRDSAVETVKLHSVRLVESGMKVTSTDEVLAKQFDSQTTLKVIVEALKRHRKIPCSLQPSDVSGRKRGVTTANGRRAYAIPPDFSMSTM